MNTEQKAKRYDEAFEKAKYWHREGYGRGCQELVEDIFPELRESYDEKVRKAILELVKQSSEILDKQNQNNMITWLEKQGKEKSWKPSKEEMDVLYGLAYITNQYDEHKEEVITRLYQDLKREFFNGSSYENMFPNTSTEDDVRRRSTIQVLEYARSLDTYNQYGKADIDKNIAWLEKQKTSEEAIQYFKENHFPSEVSDFQTAMNIAVAKAYDKGVKDGLENRGQTFTKKEVDDAYLAGVRDAKKELEKQSEQDKIEALRTEYEKGRADAIAEMEKPTWSVEDMSKVQRICKYLDEAKKYYADITEVRECIDWLKSLKNRVLPQPKQEWSEEDERLCSCIIEEQEESLDNVKNDKYGHSEIISDLKEMYRERIDWLKSLKDRYTWKPSNEQIDTLEHFVRSIGESGYASPYDNNTKLLYSLLEQLKKLKA